MDSTFKYNQPADGLSDADAESFYAYRQLEMTRSLDLVLQLLSCFEEGLLEDQEHTEAEQLRMFIGDEKVDPLEKEGLLSLIRNRHEQAIAKSAKHLQEVTELKHYFQNTHCLQAENEKLGSALKILKATIDKLLRRAANGSFIMRSNDGNIDFTAVEIELSHIIVHVRCCVLIGESADIIASIHSYPYNVWD